MAETNGSSTNGILKLQTNVPELIALRFAEGKPTQSQFGGDQIMFSLVDGRKAFLPPIVGDKIRSAGIQPGETFSLCKKEIVRGTRRTVEYQVDVPQAPPPEEVAPVAPVPAGAPAMTQPNQDPAAPTYNGNSTPAREVPSVEAAQAKLLERTGKMALDAVLAVEEYARFHKHLENFSFGPDNVQKVWACLFINATKNGGR